jgi:hypothetical protein
MNTTGAFLGGFGLVGGVAGVYLIFTVPITILRRFTR